MKEPVPTPLTNNASTMLTRMAQEPLLVAPGSEELLASFITSMQAHEDFGRAHEVTGQADDDDEFWGDPDDDFMAWLRPYNVADGVLTIPVYGVLVHKMSFKFGSWATGYEYIRRAFDRGMDDPEVNHIVFDHNSPGGMVAGNFELTEHVASRRGEKPISAIANDYAFSASYNLAAAADPGSLYLTRSGGVGSVGVVTMHVDYSGNLEKSGIKVTFIFAGKHKTEGNPFEALPEAAKARIQGRIDRLYGEFVGLVAENRGMDEKAVRGTEALTYDASDAISVGFADKIGTLDELIAASHDGAAGAKDGIMSITQEQMDAAVAAARAEGEAAGKKAGASDGANAERERVSAILGSDEAQKRPAAAQMMIDLGVDADKAKEQMAKLPEEVQAEAPNGEGKGKDKASGEKSAFELAMEGTPNPDVGADAPKNEGEPEASTVDKIFGSIGMAPATRQ